MSGGGFDQSSKTDPSGVSIERTAYPSGAPGSPRTIKLSVATLASSVLMTRSDPSSV